MQVEVYPTTKILRSGPWVCPAWALGVTFGTVVAMDSARRDEARIVALGEYDLARIEPRVRPHRDEAPGSALVYRRARGARRDGSLSGLGRPVDHEAIQALANKKLLPIAELDRGFVHPTYPGTGHRIVLSGRQNLRLHQRDVRL